MPNLNDETIDYDESSEAPELGFFLQSKPMQDGMFEFLRSTTTKYQSRLDDLGIKHFSADEVFYLGGSHYAIDHDCSGKNSTPGEDKWPSMDATILELEAFRVQLGSALFINSAYRDEDYNTCVGGAPQSLHMRFNAIDFRSNTLAPREVARALRIRRDAGAFVGGIGIYNTFVHIDTRGENKNFKGRTTPMSDFNYVFS